MLTQCAVTTTMAFGFDGSSLAAPRRKVAREAWEGWPGGAWVSGGAVEGRSGNSLPGRVAQKGHG